MALIIEPDGSRMSVHPDNLKTFTLKEMQTLVGGYIERVGRADFGDQPCDFWGNEEGRLQGLPVNSYVSLLLGVEVVGPILIATESETE